MPRFNVGIHGDGNDLDEAEVGLDDAGIAAGRLEGSGSGGSFDVLIAHVDDATPEGAMAEVRKHLPPDGRYTLGPTVSGHIPEKFAKRRPVSSPDLDMEYRALEIRRALVPEPQTGEGIHVEAVHLYEDSVRVHYVLPIRLDRDDVEGARHPTRLILTDDVGTDYYPISGGSGGHRGPSGVEVRHGYTWFKPAVPTAARRLTVATLIGDVEFDL